MIKDIIDSVGLMRDAYSTTSSVSKVAGVIFAGVIGLGTTLSTMHKAGLYSIRTGLDALKKDNLKNFISKVDEKLSF